MQKNGVAIPVLLGGCCILYWSISPLALGAMVEGLHFPQSRIGLMFGGYNIGIALACIAAVALVRKVDCRWLTGGGFLLAAASFAGCLEAHGFRSVLAFHVLAGLGCGFAYAPVLSCLANTRIPARSYALLWLSVVVQGAIVVFLVPRVFAPGALLRGTYVTMVAYYTVGAMLSPLMPARIGLRPAPRVSDLQEQTGRSRGAALLLAFSAIFLMFAGYSAVWAYTERIVAASGQTAAFAGTTLTVSLVAGAMGSAVASLAGLRFGVLRPLLLAVALSVGSVVLLYLSSKAYIILLAIALNGWAWNLGSAFQMGQVALSDPSARWPAAIPAAQLGGSSFGSATVAGLVTGGDFTSLYVCASVLWLLALGANSLDLVAHRRWRGRQEDTRHPAS